MPVSRRGFLGVLLGAVGAGATARPAPATGGVFVGIDGGAIGEAATESILPAGDGGFAVPPEFVAHLKKLIYGEPPQPFRREVFVQISRDDRSGKQAPDQAHNLETLVQIELPQPTGG